MSRFLQQPKTPDPSRPATNAPRAGESYRYADAGNGDVRAHSAPPKRRDSREVVFNRVTQFEGACVECGHLHEMGVVCGKVADLLTLDPCPCTRGRKLYQKFVSRAQKRLDRIANLKADAERNAGFVCSNDPRCGVSFPTDIDYYVHMREDCAYRKVPCPNAGCGMECLQRDLVFHRRYCAFKDAGTGGEGGTTVVRVARDPQTNETIVTTELRLSPGDDAACGTPRVGVPEPTELSPARQGSLLRLFHILDKDGDGCLTPAELAPLLRVRTGRSATEQQVGTRARAIGCIVFRRRHVACFAAAP
jgi:hypothetical protein